MRFVIGVSRVWLLFLTTKMQTLDTNSVCVFKTSFFRRWVYCLLNVLLTPVSAFVTFLRHRKAAYVAMVLWSCELALVIFGAIVVYRPGPCAQFKATGLWTLAKMIFVLKIIYVGLMMFGTAIFCSQHVIKNCDKRSTRATSQLAQVEAQVGWGGANCFCECTALQILHSIFHIPCL